MELSTERYRRQQALIGETGQKALKRARVALIGLGGLGSVAAFSLAGLGVGELLLIDFDAVSPSNLNRQFLYSENDLNRSKADCAQKRLSVFNSEISLRSVNCRVDEKNAASLLDGCDVVLCCIDELKQRLSLSKALFPLNAAQIHAGVEGFDGTLLVSNAQSPCLACAYPNGVGSGAHKNAVSLPPITSALSALMAQATLLTILGRGDTLTGKLYCFDGRRLTLEAIPLVRRKTCPICGGAQKR